MKNWTVGRVRITKIVEMEAGGFGTFLLPDATPEEIAPIAGILEQHKDDKGGLNLSIHSFVVETPERTILVDTCVGNHKKRAVPAWNDLESNFLEKLAEAGFERGRIDLVVCTHLHIDHVGWNTILQDGRWVPTFPNARYIFSRKEYAYWKACGSNPERAQLFEDSIDPVVEAGLVDLTEDSAQLTPEVSLVPTPGHTPGHFSVEVKSLGQTGLITGDFIHHPVQLRRNDWCTRFDEDSELAKTVRQALVSRLALEGALVFGTAFPEPSVGRFVQLGGGLAFEPVIPHE